MKRISHIIIVVLFFAHHAAAQDKGDVVVHTDPRLSVLMKKKQVVMQASAAKPVVHHVTEPHIATSPMPAGTEATPKVITEAKVAPEKVHNTPPEATHPAANVPVFIREKEGRVIYSGKGFRVQIYSGSDREKAIQVKTEFMRNFPAIRTYLTYTSPCFRVKVGNYRNRSDAAGMLREAKSMYGTCVIVPDIITINTY